MERIRSKLQEKPKSRILKCGYINVYSKLTGQEERQIYYKTLYKKNNSEWDESLVYLSKRFKEIVNPNSRLLDIGCGNGNYVVDENRKIISWATGIDVSKKVVERNQCLDEIVIGNIEKIPFKDNSFDCVSGLWVLEHLENPEKVLDQIYRVLKSKGKFIFVAPNINYLPLRLVMFVKFSKFNYLINKRLFGRERKDIFKTYYKANSVTRLKNLTNGKFRILELRTNYDPSYTSFNQLTYKVTNFLNDISTKLGLTITHPHIVGIFEKK
ncbi:MAG: hypothetical protein UT24_C0004G0082 [Candidatus Woesebacteria bacterium GW2011_GWB1_39_12]|uniref:Methyltransferase type 11 domain-containing protein n=2 Tax=Candidatus Woeseibacteriota TaxID=1752722 RepID=A0A0G0PK11_9BACT|nr:MAG: hypothetical protein UT23_C0003G0086 [Candidatus Woesebacteria bacterium GW2011_GWA1_39_12]KKR01519.1 MAG: hypothetical protein UT24_C0004G0082 [Candidatus Woesebacteria bacterium GW2011_GWB1_39_12]